MSRACPLGVLLLLALAACASPAGAVADPPTATPPPPSLAVTQPPTAAPAPSPTTAPAPVPLPQPTDRCGTLLPVVPSNNQPDVTELVPGAAAVDAVREQIPPDIERVFDFILANPGQVGLVAFRVSEPERGVYLNADTQMPLASVVKIIHLVAYAEAVAAGDLNPLEQVPLADIEAFYQPTLDLGAHDDAIAWLSAQGRVFGDDPTVVLDAVPEMMIEFSSNAATDYLHMRLGQARIEQTAIDLGLTSQTAPCPFVGQFLAMGNHLTPPQSDSTLVQGYLDDPLAYGNTVMALTLAFSTDAEFRAEAIAWRRATRSPDARTQRVFSHALNAHASPRDYATLMGRLALNAATSPDAAYTVRRILEWPTRFDANQAYFSNIAYKGGSLPGILTVAYYAWRYDDNSPIVVAFFLRDLPGQTYSTWRRDVAHDEFARWLLIDPDAIPLLRAVLTP